VLKSETVTLMGQNQIGAVSVPALKTALPRRVAGSDGVPGVSVSNSFQVQSAQGSRNGSQAMKVGTAGRRLGMPRWPSLRKIFLFPPLLSPGSGVGCCRTGGAGRGRGTVHKRID
jgi:hypothetical protein